MKEALTPFTDDIPADMQVLSDLVIGETLGSEQDHLSALNLKIRQRILMGSSLKLFRLGLGQSDLVGAFTRRLQISLSISSTPGSAFFRAAESTQSRTIFVMRRCASIHIVVATLRNAIRK